MLGRTRLSQLKRSIDRELLRPLSPMNLRPQRMTEGFLDVVDPADIPQAEQDLIDFVKTRHSDVINSIKTTGELPEEELKAAVEAFVSTLEKKEE